MVLAGCQAEPHPGPASPSTPAEATAEPVDPGALQLGGRVAFSSDRSGDLEVWELDLDGLGLRQLSAGPGRADFAGPAHATGGVLAISSAQGSDGHLEQLWVLRAGHPPRALGRPGGKVRNPVWARDGTWIAYESDVDSFREIYRVGAEGGEPVRLTHEPAGNYEPVIAPDGSRVAFVSSRGGGVAVWSMAPDGGDLRRLTAGPGEAIRPTWSPDGGSLAVFRGRGGTLWVERFDLASPADAQVLWRPPPGAAWALVPDQGLAWSPDGASLAFTVREPAGGTAIQVVDAVTGQKRWRSSVGPHDELASWAPGGEALVFSSDVDGNTDLWVSRPDGTELRRLTDHPATDWLPRWR